MIDLIKYDLPPEKGLIAKEIDRFGTDLVIGHPSYKNHDTIYQLLENDLKGILNNFNFKTQRVLIVVSDGSKYEREKDDRVLHEVVRFCENHFEKNIENVKIIYSPYRGYNGNKINGKGSALYLIYSEFNESKKPQNLILLDSDLKESTDKWIGVYKKVIGLHSQNYGQKKPFLTTSVYERHFTDASLTRFFSCCITAVSTMFVPGAISGDICMNRKAVEKEFLSRWSNSRLCYGTDITTTLNNVLSNSTVYQVQLGEKKHDITDAVKLSFMAEDVITAALEVVGANREKIVEKFKDSKNITLENPTILDENFTKEKFINPSADRIPDFLEITYKAAENFRKEKEEIEEFFKICQDDTLLELVNMLCVKFEKIEHKRVRQEDFIIDFKVSDEQYSKIFAYIFVQFIQQKVTIQKATMLFANFYRIAFLQHIYSSSKALDIHTYRELICYGQKKPDEDIALSFYNEITKKTEMRSKKCFEYVVEIFSKYFSQDFSEKAH